MKRKYKALDLFCCAGGAGEGLYRAGFEVTGVDIVNREYGAGDFIRADALTFPLDGYDFIWASPPCQAHTQMSNRWRKRSAKADSHRDLIDPIRQRLRCARCFTCIENVPGAPLLNPICLTGRPFNLKVHRPRYFEVNFHVPSRKANPSREIVGVYGDLNGRRLTPYRADGSFLRAAKSNQEAREAMGIYWPMSDKEVTEAIPPAYSEWIGKYAIRAIELYQSLPKSDRPF